MMKSERTSLQRLRKTTAIVLQMDPQLCVVSKFGAGFYGTCTLWSRDFFAQLLFGTKSAYFRYDIFFLFFFDQQNLKKIN